MGQHSVVELAHKVMLAAAFRCPPGYPKVGQLPLCRWARPPTVKGPERKSGQGGAVNAADPAP